MHLRRPRYRSTIAVSSLVLMLALAGCADDGVVYDYTQNFVNGNWQVSATGSGLPLPMMSGALVGTSSGAFTGVLHADATTGCATAAQPIAITGTTDDTGLITLTGPVAGGTLTISGGLSSDGRSLTNATVNVTGGQCAFVSSVKAQVQNYSSVTGTYVGTFSDTQKPVMNVTANLTQSANGDTDGNFTLSGTANLGTNPCFVSPVTVVNSQVTGGAFVLTYTDNTTGNSVTATGSFSTDGSTLTVSNWSLTGPCGADTGTGTLSKQSGS
ncbi:MAG TPA: hypothetical protein VGU25_09280 [Acidobacteriaceae bacterium]|nr:hypothetical protein [Acidobacteriaceae bacterium]